MERLKVIVKALDDKRAEDIDVLDIHQLTSLGDYFVICTCNSNVQVRAAADEVEVKAKEAGIEPLHVEGYRGGSWILIDLGDIIVHVMDVNNNPINYGIVTFTVEGKEIIVKVVNGSACLNYSFKNLGLNTVRANYDGSYYYDHSAILLNLNVSSTILADDEIKTYNSQYKFIIIDNYANPLNNTSINIILNSVDICDKLKIRSWIILFNFLFDILFLYGITILVSM